MRRLQTLALLFSLSLFTLCVAVSMAGAEDAVEPGGYRELVEQALSEYGAKNYEEASALFTRAHALFPNARTLRGMGMAAFELRHYDESVRHLEAALSSSQRPLEGELRKETQALAVRARGFVATLELRVKPDDASVSVDGAPIATNLSEGPLLLRLGEHVLEAKAEGHATARRELRVRGGESLRVDLELEPKFLTPPDREQQPRSLARNPWLWSGVGAVVVGALVAGLVIGLRKEPETRVVPSPTANDVDGYLSSLEAR